MGIFIRFWGTRGSLPASLDFAKIQGKIARALKVANGRHFEGDGEIFRFIKEQLPFSTGGTYGTNTPCVAISKGDGAPLLLDGGSGLRSAGLEARNFQEQHLLLSHLHWDHIQGIPFYRHLYESDFHLVIHSCHAEAEAALRAQMASPFFPIRFDDIKARVTVKIHKEREIFDAGGFSVVAMKQIHPGDSFCYRVTAAERTVVYSTDSGFLDWEKNAAQILDVFAGADVLIYDAMLSEEEALSSKASWGHSCSAAAIDLAALADVKNLVLTHHDPACSDDELDERFRAALAYAEAKKIGVTSVLPSIVMAYDGLEMRVG